MPTFSSVTQVTPIERVLNNWQIRTYNVSTFDTALLLSQSLLLPLGVQPIGSEQIYVQEGRVLLARTAAGTTFPATAFEQVGVANFATTAARDTAYARASAGFRKSGALAFCQDTGLLYRWNVGGAAWAQV